MLKTACEKEEIDLNTIRGVFITHEHSDHVKGLPVFLKNYNVPVYATEKTLIQLEKMNLFLPDTVAVPLSEKGNEVCGMRVLHFHTSHDTVDSVGYSVIMPDERKISVCTDLGYVSDEVQNSISKSDLILLESNHDIKMLKEGFYPYQTKQRILSDVGHLSNEVCAKTSEKLLESGTTRFVLGHLSRENNTPELAYSETFNALDGCGARIGIDYTLTVAGDCNKMIRF